MENELKFKKGDFCRIFSTTNPCTKRRLPFNEQLSICFNEIETKRQKLLTDKGKENLKRELTSMKVYFDRLSTNHCRDFQKIASNHSEWINKDVVIPESYFKSNISKETNPMHELPSYDFNTEEPQPSTSTGIKRSKPFSELSKRQRQNIIKENAESIEDPSVALYAARYLAKKSGDKDLAKRITEIIHPEKATPKEKETTRIDPDRYLAHMIYTGESKQGHRDEMLMINKGLGVKIIPGYEKILEAKKKCYPENIEVNHKKASVPLNDLLIKSLERLYEANSNELNKIVSKLSLCKEDLIKTEMICMWGMDGTTGQSQYNQPNNKDDNEVLNDSSLFTVSMTFLKLIHKDGEGKDEKVTTLWENESPQSPHSCRPIQLEFVKESEEYVLRTKKDIDEQIENLPFHLLKTDMGNVLIDYSFFFTMIDGKILNMVTGTRSSQNCPICGATPTQMKDKTMIGKFKPKEGALQYNIQPMHSTMNTVKNLYHISYREGINKHQMRAQEDKIKHDEQKKAVQQRMKDEFHVRIDQPRAGGAGTSDTGAVARKLLKEPEKLAEVLHLDKEVVKRISVVMNAVCCGEKLDPKKFGAYCEETYEKYLTAYFWYPPCASLHKVLEHAKDVIITLPVSLGKMGEDGAESQNKYLRKDREDNARKTSRVDNLTDMFHRRLEFSDPVIVQKYLKDHPRKTKRIEDLSEEVQQLLLIQDEEDEEDERDDVYTDGNIARNFFSLLMDDEENIYWGEDFEEDEDYDEDYEQSESEESNSSVEDESSENENILQELEDLKKC